MQGVPRRASEVIVIDCRRKPSGCEELPALRPVIERLLRAGVVVVVVAGANPHDVGAQLSTGMRGPHRRNLRVVTEPEALAIEGALALDVSDPRGLGEQLREQAALHQVRLPTDPPGDPAWMLVEEGFVLAREHELESLFALSNGYLGSRGALVEGSRLSSPATFLAGVYDAASTLVQMPEWTSVSVALEGEPLRLDQGEILEHRRILDMERGMSWRVWRQRDLQGRVTNICGLRLVSLADRHLSFQSIRLTPENYSAHIEAEGSSTAVVDTEKGVTAAFAAASILERPDELHRFFDARRWKLHVQIGETYRLDRIFAVYTSREVDDPVRAARQHIEEILDRERPEGIVRAHVDAWRDVWAVCDVRVEGDDDAQRALRFAAFHLASAANPNDERVSIGARALTGWAYAGHVFWDTEIFMLPFFIHTRPDVARTLLMYRYHTLPAARARAARYGFEGALYAWESADTGDDVTPVFVPTPAGEVIRIYVGEQEQHISADVAYGVWSYWRWTGDDDFLLKAGAEILFETARFWASRVEPGEDGLLHINGVIGPDEYHETVDDNAYTNGMARWNLEAAAEIAAHLAGRQLPKSIALAPDEPQHWLRTAARIYTGYDPESGLFEQFRGYFDLEPLDLSEYDDRAAPIDVVLGRERIQGSQAIKQADVVMLIHLLWDRFSPRTREANFRFYEPRTDHGSSLSPPVHAAVAARLEDVALAEKYFRLTAEIDLANNMGNAAGGIHAAALGGLWQAAVFGFAGLRLSPEGPVLDPHLPPSWKRLDLSVDWRGRRFDLSATRTMEVRP